MAEGGSRAARYTFWGTIIAALISAAVLLYISRESVDTSDKKEVEVEASKHGTTILHIEKIQLTPVRFEMPTAFFLEIRNTGLNDADEFTVAIDFGQSTVKQFEIKPRGLCQVDTSTDAGKILTFDVPGLNRNESFYVYAFIDVPIFKSIVVNSGQLVNPLVYTFDDYSNLTEDTFWNRSSGFLKFLLFILGGAILVFAIYFTVVAMTLLSRRLKI